MVENLNHYWKKMISYKKSCLQPEFGMHIKTPPQNRKPMALIETSVREFEPDRSLQASKCRTEGVGNEDGGCFEKIFDFNCCVLFYDIQYNIQWGSMAH